MNANVIAEFQGTFTSARIIDDCGGYGVEFYRMNKFEGYAIYNTYGEASEQANKWTN